MVREVNVRSGGAGIRMLLRASRGVAAHTHALLLGLADKFWRVSLKKFSTWEPRISKARVEVRAGGPGGFHAAMMSPTRREKRVESRRLDFGFAGVLCGQAKIYESRMSFNGFVWSRKVAASRSR